MGEPGCNEKWITRREGERERTRSLRGLFPPAPSISTQRRSELCSLLLASSVVKEPCARGTRRRPPISLLFGWTVAHAERVTAEPIDNNDNATTASVHTQQRGTVLGATNYKCRQGRSLLVFLCQSPTQLLPFISLVDPEMARGTSGDRDPRCRTSTAMVMDAFFHDSVLVGRNVKQRYIIQRPEVASGTRECECWQWMDPRRKSGWV